MKMSPRSLMGTQRPHEASCQEAKIYLEDFRDTVRVMTTDSPSKKESLNFLQPLGMRFQQHMVTELQKGNFLLI